MKALKILFFFLFFCKTFAQNIRGVVVDSKTNEPLPSANVYISNTTKGTQTDLDGKFNLTNLPIGEMQLVVSFVGYESFQQKIRIEQGKNIEITARLTPNNQILDEVAIKSGKDKTWEKQLKQFKRGFFGMSPNASKCKILNEWVLDFDVYPNSGALVAKAQRPLEIENRSLGYKLFYDLKEFKQTTQNVTFVGSSRFELLQPTTEKEEKLWEENRRNTYLGSTNHFFKSLVSRTLEKDGYLIYKLNSNLDYSNWASREYQKLANVISDQNSQEIFQNLTTTEFAFFPKLPIEIIYNRKTSNSSQMTRLKQFRPTVVMQDGWINDPLAFEVLGHWSNERISDMLPREYGNTVLANPSVVVAQVYNFPKIYLHTNKSDYVTGERIWFSSYITEGKNHTLLQENRPLYVQLYNPLGEWIAEETIYSDKGRGTGYIAIDDSLFSGIYRLKAFTKEMLNAPITIFEKKIVVQNPKDNFLVKQKIENSASSIEVSQLKINLASDKEFYKSKEKISIKIDVKSFEEMPTSGTFSVSVVDFQKLNEPIENIDINTSLTNEITDIQPITNQYFKETNLSMRGSVKNQRTGKLMPNARVLAMLLDSTSHQTKVFDADKKGKFWVEKIDFEGEQVFTYDITTKKNSLEPEAVIFFEQFPPHLKLPILTSDQVMVSEEKRKDLVFLSQNPDGQPPKPTFQNTQIAESDEKKEDIYKPAPGVQKIYHKADYTVTFDDKSPRFSNVYEMIQGNLPGVRVIGNITSGYRIFIRGIGTWNNNDPLIILDGMETGINSLNGFINPMDVERIDLLSSGGTAASYGSRGANGVIVIYTKRSIKKDENIASAKRYLVRGYQREVKYLHTDYQEVSNETNPDNRTTIYWNPEIITNEKGEANFSFYASGNPTTYRIIIEGMNAYGQVGRKETRIDVK